MEQPPRSRRSSPPEGPAPASGGLERPGAADMPMPIQSILHHATDSVAVVVSQNVRAGGRIGVWNMEDDDPTLEIDVLDAVPLGHKIAMRDIPAGAVVLKYGAPIGKASVDIRAGQHVHLHNLRSSRW